MRYHWTVSGVLGCRVTSTCAVVDSDLGGHSDDTPVNVYFDGHWDRETV